MANATLTLKIAGTVNGKTIAYTGTQEVDNIDTVISRIGQATVNTSLNTLSATGGTTTPIVEQDHDIMLLANVDTRADIQFAINNGAGTLNLVLEPGAFFIIQKADAGGNMNISATATTTTMVATTDFEIGRYHAASGAAKFQMFGCYNYAS